ncbi:MAG TPA: hypothetical protein HPP87_07300 [Planctomycetes bacterium]|nr:hypothetical protein [Planctomycetota bacterium]
MSDYIIAIAALVVVLSFWFGLLTGYLMHRAAHRDGVRLMDRVKHGEIPYDVEYEQNLGQTTTGGNFEPLFNKG